MYYFPSAYITIAINYVAHRGFPVDSVVKNLPANVRDMGLTPRLRRCPGEVNGNLLHCSCQDNPMDRGACWVLVLRVAKRHIWLSMRAIIVFNVHCSNIRIIGVPEEEDKKKGHEKILEEIIVENFPKMRKEVATQVQETQRIPNRINPR